MTAKEKDAYDVMVKSSGALGVLVMMGAFYELWYDQKKNDINKNNTTGIGGGSDKETEG